MVDAEPKGETIAQMARQVRSLLRYQVELGWRNVTQAPARASEKVLGRLQAADSGLQEDAGLRDPEARSQESEARSRRLCRDQAQRQTSFAPGAVLVPNLAAIRTELGECTRCKLHNGRTTIVFGVGSAHARLMFVGEGPGRDEDLQGEPFVGAAGQLLDKMIGAMGLTRAEVYIANTVKCRPPQNQDPEPDELAACRPFLDAQIAAVAPEVIVTLGRHAAHSLLNVTTAMTRLRGQWCQYRSIAVMPTFHPAYLLRKPEDKKLVWKDLQLAMQRLGLTLPARSQ